MSDETELLRDFERNGFVAIRGFVRGAELGELLANVRRFVSEIVPRLPSEHAFYEDKSEPATLKQIQQMGEHDVWFRHLFTTGKVRAIAELLLNGPVVPKNVQYFDKPIRCNRPTPPHQDGRYFMLEPCEAVTMWLALDPVDEANGCVRYVPGSHRRGLRPHARTQTLGFSQGITDYPCEDDREVALPAAPGDLLMHHAMTIHRADANRSVRPRRALGFIYYSEQAREDVAAHAAYQRQLAKELRATGRL